MDHAPIVAERFDSACRAHYFCVMSVAYNDLRRRVRCTVTFEACLPRKAKELPSGPAWIHEIKHDGFRILARRDGAGVRLFTRNGHDFTPRFPLAAAAVAARFPTLCFPSQGGIAGP
jgi:ATP-dependent DNA ligase